MCSLKNTLLYITSEYPNEQGDTSFIKTEIKYLSEYFKKIIVLSHGSPNRECLKTPNNVVIKYLKTEKKFNRYLNYFKKIFCIPFWKEFFLILRNKKKIVCLKQALLFLGRAELESKQIEVILKEYDVNILYSFWYTHSVLACCLALNYSERRYKPVLTRAHRFDLYEYSNNYNYQPYKKYMDKRVDTIFFISKDGLEYYKRKFATCDEKKYKLKYLGTENTKTFVSHDYNKYIRLLSVSNIISVKRVNLIIDILFECEKLGMNIVWTHIGTGKEEKFIKHYADNKLGKAKKVKYTFLGYMPNDGVLEYYRKNDVDLFISTSESEGLPVSMMETMSYGIPVIAPDVGGISEIVDNNCGYLVTKNNCVKDVVEVLKRYTHMSAIQKQKKALSAYEKWNEKFNAEKNYAEFCIELQRSCK